MVSALTVGDHDDCGGDDDAGDDADDGDGDEW